MIRRDFLRAVPALPLLGLSSTNLPAGSQITKPPFRVLFETDHTELFEKTLLRPGESPEYPLDLCVEQAPRYQFLVKNAGAPPRKYDEDDFIYVRDNYYAGWGKTRHDAAEMVESKVLADAEKLLLAAAAENFELPSGDEESVATAGAAKLGGDVIAVRIGDWLVVTTGRKAQCVMPLRELVALRDPSSQEWYARQRVGLGVLQPNFVLRGRVVNS